MNGEPSTERTRSLLWLVSVSSIYLLDTAAREITRVTGIRPPTSRQGPDGTPRRYEELLIEEQLVGAVPVDVPRPGAEFVVSWGGADMFSRVSTIVAVTDRAAWGRSFWIGEPEDDDRDTGVVMVAGMPTMATKTLGGALVTAALLTAGASDTPTATALGVVSACDPHGARTWSAMDAPEPALATPRDDGWRRPWDVPPGFAV